MARQASSTDRRLIRTAVMFAFSTLVLLGLAPQANAAAVGYNFFSRTLYYVGKTGEANNLTITSTADSFVFSDPGATINSGFGCKLVDVHGATCSSKYIKSIYVKTGDLDDTISISPLTTATVDCGTGTDKLLTPSPNVNPVGCELVNPPAAPTLPVTPPTVTPPAPPLSIVQPVSTMSRRGLVPLTLSCSAASSEPCTGTIVFILPKKAKQAGVHAARRGAPNIIGRERIVVRNGKKRRVKVSMTGKGRRAVKRSKRLKVTAKLQVTQGGQTTITTQQVTIKAPRKR